MWPRLYVNCHVILILIYFLLSTKLLTSFILKSYSPHFQFPTSLATVTSNSLLPLSYRLGYKPRYINTSFFQSRSHTRLSEPLLDCWLARKDYLQISAFPVRWWWSERRSTKESHWRSHEWSGEKSAGWTQSGLTLGTSTSASIRPPLCGGGPPSLCGGGPSSLCGGDGRRSRRNSRWSSGFTQMDPDGWLDVSAWFISWMRLRLGPLGF